ncbi:hypothetical protein ACQB60_29840 [Actinomycetota bacterium Odt1-20B]
MTAVIGLLTALIAATLAMPGAASAQGGDPPDRPANWNMQGGTYKWAEAGRLLNTHNVVALQEAPLDANGSPASLPFGARRLAQNELPHPGELNGGLPNGVGAYAYRPDGTSRGAERYLYYLPVVGNDENPQRITRALAFLTTQPVQDVAVIANPYDPYRLRPLLGVRPAGSNVMHFSIHGSAGRTGGGRGFDTPRLVSLAAAYAHDHGWDWAVLGDYNREPESWDGVLPNDWHPHASGQATHQNGRELDYMISNLDPWAWNATVLNNGSSDHWPVAYGALAAGADVPAADEIHAPSAGAAMVLDAAGASTDNGTQIITYDDENRPNQQFQFVEQDGQWIGGHPVLRIQLAGTNQCIDRSAKPVEEGNGSAFLQLQSCHGPNENLQDSQNFTQLPGDVSGAFRLRHAETGNYVDVLGDAFGRRSPLGIWPYKYKAGNQNLGDWDRDEL